MIAMKAAAREGARLAAGPLALAAFFLPWGAGPGPLAATDFSGPSLVAFAGRLQILDLPPAWHAALLTVRIAVLGVAITATWRTLLALIAPRHRLYGVSGGYLAGAAVALLAVRLAISVPATPPAGVLLLAAAAVLIAAGPIAHRVGCIAAGLRLPRWNARPRAARAPSLPSG